MTGNTSRESVLKSLHSIWSAWGLIALGVLASVAVSFFALNIVIKSYGFGAQPALAKDDHVALSENNNPSQSSTVKHKLTKPVRILIPSINFGLDIVNSTIDVGNNKWPLSDNFAHYANFTPGLGSDKGTLLIYGHNSWGVMRKTGDIKVGDTMILIDDSKQKWDFKLVSTKNVSPDEVEFIYEDTPFRVVALTCNGWNDEYRRLMFFEPID